MNMTAGNLQKQPAAWGKPLMIGAGIGLALMSLFLSGVDDPNPGWGKYWMIRPLALTTLGGAAGGFFFYLMSYFGSTRKLNKALVIIIGVIGFVIALFMGSILGMDGTLWD